MFLVCLLFIVILVDMQAMEVETCFD